jgi:regulator of cell morphogenesis and NO signaling
LVKEAAESGSRRSALFIGEAAAADGPNKDDAVAMVKKEVTVIKEQGADKAVHGAKAMAAKQKDPTQLMTRLAALEAAAAPSDGPEDTDDLIDMILTRFYETHRREVPELVKLARRVEVVHRDVASVPAGLADLLQHIGDELESHMQKEEQILFPMIRSGGHPMIEGPISVMLAEHDEHGANLRKLEALTNDFTPPAEACTTWRALYVGARKLADDVMEHIHTENNILFPRFTS